MPILQSRAYLYTEYVLLMLALPLLLLACGWQKFLLPGLWIAALYCMWVRKHTDGGTVRMTWHRGAITRATMGPIFLRFLVCAMLLAVGTFYYTPWNLFSFVRSNPWFWALIMLLYPLLSVIAQEIIYRWFFFARYGAVFRSHRALILASAIAFGFGHIVFNNWVSPLLCIVGGALFAGTYARHRSLALVSLEHALYGDFVFTIGLGWYFYHGNVH